MLRICLLILSAAMWIYPSVGSAAGPVGFEGHFVQGGLVVGQTLPRTKIRHGKRDVQVSDKGVFILGFDRDAPAEDHLSLKFADGREQKLPLIVRAQTYKTTRIDGLPKRKVTPKKEDLKRIRSDNAKIGHVRTLNSPSVDFLSGFVWPVGGRISGVFGSQRILNGKPRRPHNGMDIAAPKGTPVLATADGIVELVHEDMFFSGKTVMINHGHGLSSVYIHMNKITVKQGSRVRQAEQIGTIGMTGRATGPHLHWGINLFKMPLDPKLIVAGEKKITRTD
jgi:murein DD-endopeptidase MepM/ murein hydrolase activator NlpD